MDEYSGVALDASTRRAWVDGVQVHLTKLEFDLLGVLISQPTRVFRRGEILRILWGHNYVGEDQLLDQQLTALRKKMGAHRYLLRTVRGVGYSLDSSPSTAKKEDFQVPRDPRLATLLRQATWLHSILENHGGVRCTDPEVLGAPADRRVQFSYHDPNGDEVDVQLSTPLRMGSDPTRTE